QSGILRTGALDALDRVRNVLVEQRHGDVVAAVVEELGAQVNVIDVGEDQVRIALDAVVQLRIDELYVGKLAQVGAHHGLAVAQAQTKVLGSEETFADVGECHGRIVVRLVDTEGLVRVLHVIVQLLDVAARKIEKVDGQHAAAEVFPAHAGTQTPGLVPGGIDGTKGCVLGFRRQVALGTEVGTHEHVEVVVCIGQDVVAEDIAGSAFTRRRRTGIDIRRPANVVARLAAAAAATADSTVPQAPLEGHVDLEAGALHLVFQLQEAELR